MDFGESLTLSVIKFSRKYFRNTWVHRLPITSRIYKKIFALAYREPEKEITFRGKRFLVATKDTSMVPSIMNQDYEAFELDIYEQIVKPGMTVLDIGGNLGIYTVIGSQLVGTKGSVHVFEPVPENITLLKHNVNLNKADNNVVIVQNAIGEKPGQVPMYMAEYNIGTHSMADNFTDPIIVPIDTLDNYVAKNNLKVDVIKMDIEGYEGHAVYGGLEVLKNKKVTVLTEFSYKMLRNCGSDPEKLAKLLFSLFKYCYLIDERKRSLRQIPDVEELAGLYKGNLLLTNKQFVI